MTSAGPNFAGSGTDLGTGPGSPVAAWGSPGAITADDGSFAASQILGYSAPKGAEYFSAYLQAKSFGFAIPGGATILGIQVDVKVYGGAGVQDYTVQLLKAGAAVGANRGANAAIPGASTYKTYGGASDTWSAGLTASDANNANFGVQVAYYSYAGGWAFVDAIRITITYSGGSQSQTFTLTQAQAVSRPATVARSYSLTQGTPELMRDGSFETDALGGAPAAPWTTFYVNAPPVLATFLVQNGWSSDGAKSCRVTTGVHTAANQQVYVMQLGAAVTPGATYRLAADFDLLAMPNGFYARVMIEWHDGSGAYISQSYGPTISALGAGASSVVAVAPPTAATGRTIIVVGNGTGTADFYVDNVHFCAQAVLVRSVARGFVLSQASTLARREVAARVLALAQAAVVSRAPPTVARTLALAQSAAIGYVQSAARALVLAQSQVLVRLALVSRALALGQVAVVSRAVARTTTLSLAQAQVLARAALLGRVFALGQAAALSRAIVRTTTAALAQAQSVVRVQVPTRAFALIQGQNSSRAASAQTTVRVLAGQAVTIRGSRTTGLALAQGQVPRVSFVLARGFAARQSQAAGVSASVQGTVRVTQAQAAVLALALARGLAVGQSQGLQLVAAGEQRFVVAQAQAVTRASAVNRVLATAQGALAAVRAALARVVTLTQAQVGLHAEQAETRRSLAQGQVATSLTVAARSLALAQPQYPALVRAVGRRFQSSQSATVGRKGALGVVLTLEQSASAGVSAVHFAPGAFTLAQAQPVSLRVVVYRTRSISQASAVRLVRHLASGHALSASATVRLVRGKTAQRSLAQGQSVATMTAVIRHSMFSVAAGQAVFFGVGARAFALSQAASVTSQRALARTIFVAQAQQLIQPLRRGYITVIDERRGVVTVTGSRLGVNGRQVGIAVSAWPNVETEVRSRAIIAVEVS